MTRASFGSIVTSTCLIINNAEFEKREMGITIVLLYCFEAGSGGCYGCQEHVNVIIQILSIAQFLLPEIKIESNKIRIRKVLKLIVQP